MNKSSYQTTGLDQPSYLTCIKCLSGSSVLDHDFKITFAILIHHFFFAMDSFLVAE